LGSKKDRDGEKEGEKEEKDMKRNERDEEIKHESDGRL